MATLTRAIPRSIVIIGPTGSGKSRLAVDVAAAINGEVVNADAVQLYAGLDVATAKVPVAERRLVPHHLMSFLPPRAVVTVRDFRALAAAAIADIASRGRVPVVVGGTGYYVQALLRESLLEVDEGAAVTAAEAGVAGDGAAAGDDDGDAGGGVGGAGCGSAAESGASAAASAHAALALIDPIMARRLHPHDTRRVSRALDVHHKTGETYSSLLLRQATRLEGAPPSLDARIYWLSVCDRSVHDARLDERVAVMLAQGLPKEIAALQARLSPARGVVGEEGNEDGGDRGGVGSVVATTLVEDVPSDLTVRLVSEYMAATGRTFVQPTDGAASTEDVEHAMMVRMTHGAVGGDGDGGGDGCVGSGLDERGGKGDHALSPTPSPPPPPPIPSSYVGLLQAIGYKEFSEYLSLLREGGHTYPHDDEGRDAINAQPPPPPPMTVLCGKRARKGTSSAPPPSYADLVAAALARGAARLRDVTHGYARKQDRWIRNRFEKRNVPLVRIDTSHIGGSGSAATGMGVDDKCLNGGGGGGGSTVSPHLSSWDTSVAGPVIADVRAWLAGAAADTLLPTTTVTPTLDGGGASVRVGSSSDLPTILSWQQRVCAPCGGRVINGADAWAAHERGKAHKRAVQRAARGVAVGGVRGGGGKEAECKHDL